MGWKYVSEWDGGVVSIHGPFTTHVHVQGRLQGKGGGKSCGHMEKHRNHEVLEEKSPLSPSSGLSCENTHSLPQLILLLESVVTLVF